jgi:hypothetical protein
MGYNPLQHLRQEGIPMLATFTGFLSAGKKITQVGSYFRRRLGRIPGAGLALGDIGGSRAEADEDLIGNP